MGCRFVSGLLAVFWDRFRMVWPSSNGSAQAGAGHDLDAPCRPEPLGCSVGVPETTFPMA